MHGRTELQPYVNCVFLAGGRTIVLSRKVYTNLVRNLMRNDDRHQFLVFQGCYSLLIEHPVLAIRD